MSSILNKTIKGFILTYSKIIYIYTHTNLFTFKEAFVRMYKHVAKKNKIYLSSMASDGMFAFSFSVLFKNNCCLVI